MLRIICGEAGTGKSALLREKLRNAALSGKKTVYLVPDQFSFEAEKLIYKCVPHEFSRSCRVTAFSREAQSILHLYGETKEYADDIAKRVVIRLALEEAKKEKRVLIKNGGRDVKKMERLFVVKGVEKKFKNQRYNFSVFQP